MNKFKRWCSYGAFALAGVGFIVMSPASLVAGLLKAFGVYTAGSGILMSLFWFFGTFIVTYLGIYILSLLLAFGAAWLCVDTYKSIAKATVELYKDDESVSKSKAFKKVEEYLNKLKEGEK